MNAISMIELYGFKLILTIRYSIRTLILSMILGLGAQREELKPFHF